MIFVQVWLVACGHQVQTVSRCEVSPELLGAWQEHGAEIILSLRSENTIEINQKIMGCTSSYRGRLPSVINKVSSLAISTKFIQLAIIIIILIWLNSATTQTHNSTFPITNHALNPGSATTITLHLFACKLSSEASGN